MGSAWLSAHTTDTQVDLQLYLYGTTNLATAQNYLYPDEPYSNSPPEMRHAVARPATYTRRRSQSIFKV